jgi:Dienelactone hydrolase and related enzymes
MAKRLFLFCFLSLLIVVSYAQQKVTYNAADGLQITADLYLGPPNSPIIILLHQAGSSRGEYRAIAPKLVNLGYSCLAVDLRSGDQENFVVNETAERAKKENLPQGYLDALPDILASIDYARALVQKPVILFGSSYSASLSLIVASQSVKVGGVIACSPGEYFGDTTYVTRRINLPKKSVFITGTQREIPYIERMVKSIPPGNLVINGPGNFTGCHGAKTFWVSSPESKDMWLALSMFFVRLPK